MIDSKPPEHFSYGFSLLLNLCTVYTIFSSFHYVPVAWVKINVNIIKKKLQGPKKNNNESNIGYNALVNWFSYIVLWPLQRSSLPIQAVCGSNAVWDVSYQSLSRLWYNDLNYSSNCFLELESGLTAGVTGQQGTLIHPRHLIPPLVYPEVCVFLGLLTPPRHVWYILESVFAPFPDYYFTQDLLYAIYDR
jgi:hypothetical protein